MKIKSLFTGRIGRPEGRKFFGSQPTHDEFCHKKNHFVTIEIFWYVVENPLGSMHTKSLRTGRSGKCRNLWSHTKVIFFCDDRFFFLQNWIVANQSFPNKLSPNYKTLSRNFCVPWMKCHMTFGINAVCIFMYRWQERQFSFSEIYRHNRHFENGYHKITISLENRAVTENTSVQLARKRN